MLTKCIIRCSGLYKKYQDAENSVEVLKDVNLTISRGQTLAILGSSGSGKSTLLHILGTLDMPDKGELYFNDENLLALNSQQQAKFRNQHLGFVYQFHHLLPEFSALENIAMPLLIANKPIGFAFDKARKLLKNIGLEKRSEHKPWQLSGGERQRIAIARAVVNEPKVVMADEPTGNLDANNSQVIIDLIKTLNAELGTTFVIVTHDGNLSEQMQQTKVLRNGIFTHN